MRLADFIRQNLEDIVSEWAEFAATRLPAASTMNSLALRNHAAHILRATADDLAAPQTRSAQLAKSRGESIALAGAPATAAQIHGLLRAKSGFDINQMASEYRALRASVLRRWLDACAPQAPHLDDIIRFNEAIDQALAESISVYTERVEQARNLFLGMLGHDMRTPLQAIQMTATHLSQLNLGETASEGAARLIRSAAHIRSLLDDLIDFNRINLGQGMAIHRSQCDLAALLEEEVTELRAAHPGRRIEFEMQGSAEGSWDGPGLQRLLGNLVVNALKYGFQDSSVRVIVTGHDQDVMVEVHNEGVPIGPSLLPTLFDPLKRGVHQDKPSRGGGGLGLGLYISREVAKAHGGDIEARSEQKGTVFLVRLPRTVGQK